MTRAMGRLYPATQFNDLFSPELKMTLAFCESMASTINANGSGGSSDEPSHHPEKAAISPAASFVGSMILTSSGTGSFFESMAKLLF
jgi:hypothetical protein